MPTQAPKEIPGARADAPASSAAEQSQAARLDQMRDRLTSLSQEARSIRSQVPSEFEPDVARIQQQMQRLGERLSELSGGRGAPRQASGAGRADPDEVIVLGAPRKADDPWDEDTANALTRFYESGEAFFGAPEDDEGGHAYQSEQQAWAASQLTAGADPRAQAYYGDEQSHAPAGEGAWLDQRFAEIARRIEQSLAQIRPESSLLSLGHRFDQLEARMSSVLGSVATRADLQELRIAEAQIDDIGLQLDQLRRQLARLDTIDTQLGALTAQLSDEHLAGLFNQGSGSGTDAGRLQAIDAQLGAIAEQLSHERLADLIGETAGRRSRELLEGHARDIGEVRGLIENLIHERRHNDENNASMLETMQQAIIRVLDRIDALELAQQHGGGPSAQPMRQEQAYEEVPAPVYQGAQDAPMSEYEIPRSSLFARDHNEPPMLPEPAPYSAAPFDMDAAFARDADVHDDPYAAQQSFQAAADALRHDYIADAHRAKLKAASRVDAGAQERASEITASLDKLAAAPKQRTRRSFFNIRSPRVLMSILILLAMIPAALLFMPRLPTNADTDEATTAGPPAYEDATTGSNTTDEVGPVPHENPVPPTDELPRKQSQQLAPQSQPDAGIFEDAGTPAADPIYDRVDTASIPTRIALESDAAATARQVAQGTNPTAELDTTPAAVMRERVLHLGAPTATPDKPLELPPATVGPFSLRMAAAKGDPSAQFEVGVRLAEGKGTDQNLEEAIKWYQRSAASGFAMAQFRLGTLYERGVGVKGDLARAQVWYSRAAEQGNVKAMHNLAVLIAGRGGDQPDYANAAKWFQEAAARGLSDSQFNLGVLYENGLGVKKDLKESYKWLTLAAKSGDNDAKSQRDRLKSQLNASDLDAAEKAAAAWKMKLADPVANDFRAAGQAWRQGPRSVAARN